MIAYLCDSCGGVIDGNNGESINLVLKTKGGKEYKLKLVVEGLEHYHKPCVLADLNGSFQTGLLEPVELMRRTKVKQFFTLGEWKTDVGLKINLFSYDQETERYQGIDESKITWSFDAEGNSGRKEIGILKSRRRGDEQW